MATTLTDSVKSDLHITSDSKDASIEEAIETAKARMQIIGVETINDADPSTAQCIKLYCRFYFNFQGEAQRYHDAFEYMADAMALSGDYAAQEDAHE